MLCPSCGARNPDGARWCSLCLHRFESARGESGRTPSARAGFSPGPTRQESPGAAFAATATRSSGIVLPVALIDGPDEQNSTSNPAPRPEQLGPAGLSSAPRAVSARAAALGIVLTDYGELAWSCRRCGTANSIDYLDCSVCGWSLFEPLKKQADPARPVTPDVRRVRAWGIVPGGGQWVLGRKGDAIARGALVVWLIGVGIALSNPLVKWAQLLFLMSGVAAWAVSARDAIKSVAETGTGSADRDGLRNPGSSEDLLGGRRLLVAFLVSLMALFSVSFFLAFEVTKSTSKLPAATAERTDPSTGATVSEPVDGPTTGSPADEGSGAAGGPVGPAVGPPAGMEGVS